MTTKRIGRREAIAAIGAAGAAVAFGCGGESPSSPSPASTTSGATNAACAVTPTETLGPYPSLTDLFRSDIRESKAGTLLTLTVKVVDANGNCAAVPNANVEIWHVDAAGNYSQYGNQTGQTYLRGIQTSNANGEVTFTTIYPGWYQGRATHIHIEVTVNGRSVKVTQIAFPEATNNAVHSQGAYATGRGTNPMSNAADGIFADSLAAELHYAGGHSHRRVLGQCPGRGAALSVSRRIPRPSGSPVGASPGGCVHGRTRAGFGCPVSQFGTPPAEGPPMSETASRENVAARIRQTRTEVDTFLSSARPRQRRLLNTTIVGGTLATALTAAPAAGGQGFNTWLTATLELAGPSWRLMCAAASLCSITATVATQLLKSNNIEENVGRALRCRAKLEALEAGLTLGQLDPATATTEYLKCVEEAALLGGA